jgi:tetratricopeptide (TPR) repeat protein
MRIRQHPFACLLLLSLLAPALTWAQQRFLRGEVVTLGTQGDESQEKGVEVILKEMGNTTTTNDYGIFRLKLSDELKAGWSVTLGVSKQGWVIYAPLEGEVHIPANLTEVIKVQLLPMGSLELLKNRTLIEKFIQDLAEQSKRPTTPEGRPEPLDLGRAIKDWAMKYGFSAQQAREEIDKWIAEVKANEEDLYKLGLAAFAERQFRKASELFTQSAEQHAQQLEAVRREERSLVEKTVRDYRLAGDAHSQETRFAEALQAYERALTYVTRDADPQLWAAVQVDIGGAYQQLGIRMADEAIHHHLTRAVAAYRQALEVYTRATLPQDWAMTQTNLGTVLHTQGTRTAGEASTALLAEAVAAYRHALEVFTRATQHASWLSHEVLFAFPDAFALNQRWLERPPDDLNVLSNFAEKHFTTGRFAACAERLTALLARPDVQPGVAAGLRVLTIPTLLALRQPAQVPAAIDALLAHVTTQTDDFRVTGSFEGVKHFISQHDGLAPYRPWLQQFFNAVQAERREALVTGLQDARQAFADKN